jgi:hypothetical protein
MMDTGCLVHVACVRRFWLWRWDNSTCHSSNLLPGIKPHMYAHFSLLDLLFTNVGTNFMSGMAVCWSLWVRRELGPYLTVTGVSGSNRT